MMTARPATTTESLEVRLAEALEEIAQLRAVVAAQARELEGLLELHSRPTTKQPTAERAALLEASQ